MELKELRETRNGIKSEVANGVLNQDSIQNLVEAEEIRGSVGSVGSGSVGSGIVGSGNVGSGNLHAVSSGKNSVDNDDNGCSKRDDVEEGRGDGKSDDAIRRRRYRAYDLPFCTNFLVKWKKITKYVPVSPTYEG